MKVVLTPLEQELNMTKAVIGIIIAIVIVAFLFSGNSDSTKKTVKNNSYKKPDRLTDLRMSIKQKIHESSFENAFEETKMLFDELDMKFVDSSDIEMLVSILESIPWDDYKKIAKNRKALKNPYLRNSFDIFFQLKSFLEKEEIFWKEFISCLEFDVRPLVFMSQNWFYEIALKRKQMLQGNDKKMMGIFIQIYLMNKEKVRKGIRAVNMPKTARVSLMKIYSAVNSYSSYKQQRSSEISENVKKKNEVPVEFKNALELYREKKMYKAMLQYIVAFIKDPGIVLLKDNNFRKKATDKFLSLYYTSEDNGQQIKLFVGFIHCIHRNMNEARPILEEVTDEKMAKLAEKILKIAGTGSVLQILKNVNRSNYIMKLGAFSMRKKPVSKAIVSAPQSHNNRKTASKQVAKLENEMEKRLKKGKYNEAIDLLKQLNKIEVKSEYLIQMGDAYEKLGMQADSIDVLEKAVKIDPERPGLQVRLADLCYNQKDIKRAKLHYGSALFNELDPELLSNCREKILMLNRMH